MEYEGGTEEECRKIGIDKAYKRASDPGYIIVRQRIESLKYIAEHHVDDIWRAAVYSLVLHTETETDTKIMEYLKDYKYPHYYLSGFRKNLKEVYDTFMTRIRPIEDLLTKKDRSFEAFVERFNAFDKLFEHVQIIPFPNEDDFLDCQYEVEDFVPV